MKRQSFQLKRYYIVTLLLTMLLLLLTACQEKDESFRILIFSNIPQDSIIKGKYIENDLEKHADFNIDLFPPVVERLVVEIVSHSGDVLIMERSMLSAAFDPEGLHSLNEVKAPVEQEAEKDLLARNEQYEWNRYAVLLPQDLPMFKEMNLASELVAVVPIYTKHKEEAVRFLDALVNVK